MFLVYNGKLSFAYQLAGAAQYAIYIAQASLELGNMAVQSSHHLSVTREPSLQMSLQSKPVYTPPNKPRAQAKVLMSEMPTGLFNACKR